MKRPVLLAGLTFIILLALTQLVVYQQSSIIREEGDRELINKLADIKERFTAVLNENISAANSLAIIDKYSQDFENFDDVARELLQNHKCVDVIGLTEKFVVKQVYPLAGNESAVGRDLLADSFNKKEVLKAMTDKGLKFSGPYLMQNKRVMAIAGRVPIYKGGEFKGFSIVVTHLSTLQRFLEAMAAANKKFVYQLSKVNPVTGKTEYFFQHINLEGKYVKSAFIPEGQWYLHVAYAPGYHRPNLLVIIIILGILLSLFVSLFVYSKIVQKRKLEHIVALKTHELNERVKELSTIYHLNNVFYEGLQNEDEIFMKLVNDLPSGWQYVDICQVKVSFDGRDYVTAGFVQPVASQSEDFKIADGRTGTIEVSYTQDAPQAAEGPFMKEERDLLNSIARSLEIYLNKLGQQKDLAYSEERFRSAFENAGIGMAILSVEGCWLRVNKSFCDMLGYTNDELLKLTFQQITHADDLQRDLEFVEQSLEGKVDFYHIDKRYIHKSGEVVWVDISASLVRDKNRKPLFFLSQAVDITERKKIARDLEFSLSLTKATIESTADGILVVNTSGKISDYNKQFLKLWQVPENIIGENEAAVVWVYARQQLVHPEIFESKINELRDAPGEEGRDVLIFTDGRVFEWHSKPQKTGADIVGRVWSFRDVTQQKRFETEIKELNADLERRVAQRTFEVNKLNEELKANVQNLETANKDLESFSYSVSHDLRAPLRAINGFAGMLVSRAGIDDEAKKLLKVITDNALKMNRLIEDLLAFSRAGRKEMEATAVDMNALVREVLDETNIHERNANTQVTVGDLPPNSGDKILLKQVWVNLISNAIKYSSKKENPSIQVGSYAGENETVYFVKDNGAGFDMKYYDKLFKVFQRVHSAEEFEGVGVGLAIVQRIITKHGGRVWAEAEENVGATFYFALPATPKPVGS